MNTVRKIGSLLLFAVLISTASPVLAASTDNQTIEGLDKLILSPNTAPWNVSWDPNNFKGLDQAFRDSLFGEPSEESEETVSTESDPLTENKSDTKGDTDLDGAI